MTPEETFAQIKDLPLFAGCGAEALRELAKVLRVREYRKGEMVWAARQPCRGLHVVLGGLLKVHALSMEGREQTMCVVGAGELAAGVPAFSGKKYPAFGTALSETTVATLPVDLLPKLIGRYPELALALLRALSLRMHHLAALVESLSLKDVAGRVAELLLKMSRKTGRETARGTEVPLPFNREELAHRIGTIREVVSRALSDFETRGFIELHRRSVVVLDREALAELAEA